jgi:hypothetical protein
MREPRQIQSLPEAPGWWALLDRANDLIEIDTTRPGHGHRVMAWRKNARIEFYESVDPQHTPLCPELRSALSSIEEESELTCEICAAPGEERPGRYYRTYCQVHASGAGEAEL